MTKKNLLPLIAGGTILGGMYLLSLQHYLLFHSIAELFSIVIAVTIFVIVWNLKDHIKNNILVFLGISFLFVGIFDILHTLSYRGMGIFVDGSNLATQLWIAGRYLQSISFFLAVIILDRKLNTKALFAAYAFITAVILSSIFVWDIFPASYVEGMGLTPFKIISEYVISCFLLLAFLLLVKRRKVFEKNIAWLFLASIAITILSELAFTLYVDAYGAFNFLGHILKIFSFYFIYRAVVIIGITQPFDLFLKSQKEESEKELAKSEYKFSRLLDSTSDRICSRDRNGAILTWNKAFADSIKYLTGVEPYVGMRTSDFLDPAQREQLTEVYVPLYKRVFGGEAIKSEFQYREPDGKMRYFELEVTPIYVDNEVVSVAEITRDVTHIKESEMKFRTVADFTYDWEYWRAAPDAPFIYISPSVERITGYRAEEFMNNPRLINEIIHPEDKSSWDRHVSDMHEKKSASQIQFRIKNKEGKVRWIEHLCHPVTDAAGNYMGVRASNRDITAQKLAQEETQKQRRELSHVARVTTVGELSAALAHQLNQPLAAILSNAQAAKRFLESESFDLQETKDILTSIIEEDQRASKVIKELSTFLKREEVSKVPLNINDIVKETLSHVQNEADSKKITMKTDLHSDLPLTLGNPTHLQQVLLNLISNGFDAIIDQNSERREMIFKTSKADHQTIQVDVQDSGTGIEDIKMEKIFEPFQSSKSSGMGIGLSINKKIIETHGGKIWATNAVEGGAIFSFTLPVEKI